MNKNECYNHLQAELDTLKVQLDEEKLKNITLSNKLAEAKTALKTTINEATNNDIVNSEEYYFKEACIKITRILCDRYKYQVSGNDVKDGEQYLFSKVSAKDFEAHIKNTVAQCLNLYQMLDIAYKINSYCSRLRELERLHKVHAVQTLIQKAGDADLSDSQQKIEDSYEFLHSDLNKSERSLANSGINFNIYKKRHKPSTRKAEYISAEQDGESTKTFLQRLLVNASSYDEAINLYINYSAQDKLLLFNRIRELKNQLISLGLATQSLTTNQLYVHIDLTSKKQIL